MDSTAGYPRDCEFNGIRFTLAEALRDDRARFSFDGPFEGRTVHWDATLVALTHPRHRPVAAATRSYIDIGPASAARRAVTVGLAIPAVDTGAIVRTIIMLRQYRRLHAGRHEFGDPAPADPDTG